MVHNYGMVDKNRNNVLSFDMADKHSERETYHERSGANIEGDARPA